MSAGEKCYRTEACGIVSFVFSTTRGRAVAATLRSANDAGYRIKFTDISCRRRKEWDGFDVFNQLKPNTPYGEDAILR